MVLPKRKACVLMPEAKKIINIPGLTKTVKVNSKEEEQHREKNLKK
jgi:hypothetical protein